MSGMIRRSNNLRVMINNTSAMMTSLMCFHNVCRFSPRTPQHRWCPQFSCKSAWGSCECFPWVLVALLLLLVMTLRSTGVNFFSRLCCTLVVISAIVFMLSINNLRFSFNNMRIVVHLFMFFLTMSNYNILALLNIGNIYNNVIINITFLMFLLFGFLVALMFLLVMTMRTIVISMAIPRIGSTIHKSGGQEDNQEFHFGSEQNRRLPTL